MWVPHLGLVLLNSNVGNLLHNHQNDEDISRIQRNHQSAGYCGDVAAAVVDAGAIGVVEWLVLVCYSVAPNAGDVDDGVAGDDGCGEDDDDGDLPVHGH